MWLALVWAAGALVVAFRFLRGHLAARRLVHTAEPLVDAAWSAALREAAASLAMSKRVELLRSDGHRIADDDRRAATARALARRGRRVVARAPPRRAGARARARAPSRHRSSSSPRSSGARSTGGTRSRGSRPRGCGSSASTPAMISCSSAGILPSSYAADLLDVARSISRDAHAHAGAICMVDRSWTEARLRRILDAKAPRRRPLRAGVPDRGLRAHARLRRDDRLHVVGVRRCDRAVPRHALRQSSMRQWSHGQSAGEPPARSTSRWRVAAEVKRRLGGSSNATSAGSRRSPRCRARCPSTGYPENGKVPDTCIVKDTVGEPEITACVNKLVLEGRFPAPRGLGGRHVRSCSAHA